MGYTLAEFWLPRLAGISKPAATLGLPGWAVEPATNPSFIEADLILRGGHSNLDAPIWFVAAPGAVGKSTLAREISARTGAVYLDLATADTVAGNYLTGGLVKNGLFSDWQSSKATALVDALDEARLRVTQKSFADFLHDVEVLSRGRRLPTILFGRVGIVEEAWLTLAELGVESPIFDIDFFDLPRAERFVMVALDRLVARPENRSLAKPLSDHRGVYEGAARAFVRGLAKAAESDGERFYGYAPVLEAVATVLSGITNPASVNEAVQEAIQGRILERLTNQILSREAGKLRAQLPPTISDSVKSSLYSSPEQLDRLASVILGTVAPAPPAVLLPADLAAYDSAVKTFMLQHPFLDGAGSRPSGAVFAAAIDSHALFSMTPQTVLAAEKHAGHGPHTPNPFLFDFYFAEAQRSQGAKPTIPPEHVVILYESIQARAAVGDIIRLTVEADEESDNADVEILISDETEKRPLRRIEFKTSQAGVLRFGRQVNGVSVDAPDLDVVIGSGNPVELVAPVSLSIGRLTLDCPEIVVTPAASGGEVEDGAIVLEAAQLAESKVGGPPLVRKGAELSVSWPGANIYPWASFAAAGNGEESADLGAGLRGLRRLIMAFRSHSRGQLARYQGKIEHARMTKGQIGVNIRERLLRDGILSLANSIYVLDSKALGRIVGATYQDLKMKRFNEKVRSYIRTILAK